MSAERNDALRQQIPFVIPPNLLLLSRGVLELNDTERILERVKQYQDFTEENDPWGEHDFGSFEHGGKKIYWKIDDYQGQDGMELVLTVFLASEY